MTAFYTPGPWTAERTRLDGHEWFVRSASRNLPPFDWNARLRVKLDPLLPLSGKTVDARSGGASNDSGCCPTAIRENEANARLIAAAPDMLEVLKRIDKLMDFRDCDYPQFSGLHEQMRAAIAKAEGRS